MTVGTHIPLPKLLSRNLGNVLSGYRSAYFEIISNSKLMKKRSSFAKFRETLAFFTKHFLYS